MDKEPEPSIWGSLRGLFTPTILFLFLNLVIGTIVVTSRTLRRAHHHSSDDPAAAAADRPHLSRVPSLGLDRLRSFNLSRLLSGEMPLGPGPGPISEPHPPSDLNDGAAAAAAGEHHFDRTRSEPKEAARPADRMMRKSASAKSSAALEKEGGAVRRPARARAGAVRLPLAEEEKEEVDTRADDFINRFRQQLKLQRLDSILRYKEMLNRGK